MIHLKIFNWTDLQDEAKAAKAIVKAIEKAEKEYQMAINESYTELSENTFKELRRALPFTRNKVDWHKILNYKIGSELANKWWWNKTYHMTLPFWDKQRMLGGVKEVAGPSVVIFLFFCSTYTWLPCVSMICLWGIMDGWMDGCGSVMDVEYNIIFVFGTAFEMWPPLSQPWNRHY
jgi:hypothetical protein